MRLFISAGEASGDAYGARIVRALEQAGAFSNESLADDLVAEMLEETRGDLAKVARDIVNIYGAKTTTNSSLSDLVATVSQEIENGTIDATRLRRETLAAVGGRRLREAGVGLTVDSSNWGALGIVESLFVALKVIEGYFSAKSLLRISGPGLFIPIDYGYINVKLAREAKKRGWKVLYFIPPGSWRKDKQGKDMPNVTDEIVTPFPWSADLLNGMGANAHCFGHPLKQMVAEVTFEGPREGVAVLPGSRMHEVARNMDAIAEAVRGLDVRLKFGVAPNLSADELERKWEDLGGSEAEFSDETYKVLKSSRAAIVCSGTATLEAALCRCPTVVIYRGSKLMEAEAKLRRPKFDYISLPNILLGRGVLPELILWHANPENIRAALEPLLEDGPDRQAQLDAFEELDASLGNDDCFGKTADLALKLCER